MAIPPEDIVEVVQRWEIAKGKRNAALPEGDDKDRSQMDVIKHAPPPNHVRGTSAVTGAAADSTQPAETSHRKRKGLLEEVARQRKKIKVMYTTG